MPSLIPDGALWDSKFWAPFVESRFGTVVLFIAGFFAGPVIFALVIGGIVLISGGAEEILGNYGIPGGLLSRMIGAAATAGGLGQGKLFYERISENAGPWSNGVGCGTLLGLLATFFGGFVYWLMHHL